MCERGGAAEVESVAGGVVESEDGRRSAARVWRRKEMGAAPPPR